MRQLLTKRVIADIKPIPDADRIELVIIDGWQVVSRKGEFKVGDACAFFEIDSFLPADDPRFAFLAKDARVWDGRNGIRLRTVKLRKQISQGLALPAALFEEELAQEDPAAAANVVLWTMEAGSLAGNAAGSFPSFIPKTDQDRIQNVFSKVSRNDYTYEVTVKHDGTSLTTFFKDGEIGVCSRNLLLKLDDAANGLYVRTSRETGLLSALERLGRNIAPQGEICGPGIQGNRGGESTTTLYLFDIFDIDAQRYLSCTERLDVIAQLQEHGYIGGLASPVTTMKLPSSLDTLLALADTAQFPVNGAQAEGVVFKAYEDSSVSFKVISNEYLLKHGC